MFTVATFPDLDSYLTDDNISVSQVVKKEKSSFNFSFGIGGSVSRLA